MNGLLGAGLLLALLALLAGAVYGSSMLLRIARDPLRQHAFLSGAVPHEHAVSRFHVRWYTVSMVFLAFDMEMVFMYPWAVVFLREGMKAMVEMLMFIVILTLGILYAWRERALRWA